MVDAIGAGKEQPALDILHEPFDLIVTPCDAIDLHNPDEYFVLKNGATILAPLLGELPHMGTASANIRALSQPAYAITFNGQSVLPGQLFQKKNGAFISNMNSATGVGFGKQADVIPLDMSTQVAQNLVSAAFSAVSIVTATYYLKGIENNLGALQDGVKDIQDFLETDKQAQILGDFDTLQRIANEMDVIKKNEKRWSAEQNTVSAILNEQAKNIHFYRRRIYTELGKYNTCKNKKAREVSARKLNQAYGSYQFCLQVYSAARLIDAQLAEQFDLPYLSKVKEDLLELASAFENTYCEVILKMWNGRDKSKDANWVKWQVSLVNGTGQRVEKVPLIKLSGLGKKLIAGSEKISQHFEETIQYDISIALGEKDIDVIGVEYVDELEKPKVLNPYIDIVSSMEATYEKPIRMIVSGEDIYLQIHTNGDNSVTDNQPA